MVGRHAVDADTRGAPEQKTAAVKRIALVASYAPSLLTFRGPLISDLVRLGHEVVCFAPDFTPAVLKELAGLGALARDFPLERTGLNPLADLKSLRELVRQFRKWRPDVVMGYTPKPAIYGSIAARLAGVPRITPMITGLGYAFLDEPLPDPAQGASGSGNGGTRRSVRLAMKTLYRLAFRASHEVIFHNRDDLRHLTGLGIMPAGLPVRVVSGSGVDLDLYTQTPMPPIADGLTFLMIARLVRYKGVAEYCAAARLVRQVAPGTRFLLVGPEETGPAGFSAAALEAWRDDVQYLGASNDIRPLIGRCHVYVLPSYGEGMPRTVLEAMAAGRPIITTDTRGCRETVDERVNGCLVPAGDAKSLAEAMISFLRRPDLIPSMARASRHKVERRFDVKIVNRDMLECLLGVQQIAVSHARRIDRASPDALLLENPAADLRTGARS